MDKEIPFSRIPEKDKQAYQIAEKKEWDSWMQYDAVEVLGKHDSQQVIREKPSRVLRSRYVFRNKNAGLVDEEGRALPVRAKARLCVQGQNCPDCMTGEVRVDAPTVQHSTLLLFLHLVASFGWVDHWRNGDISSAFLQGEETKGEPLYMYPPERGLPGIERGQILRLKRPVYGRPDAPRAWYEQISKFIMSDMGYTRSVLDPAFFVHRDFKGKPDAMLVLHVDDLMVATNGNPRLKRRLNCCINGFPSVNGQKSKMLRKGFTIAVRKLFGIPWMGNKLSV